MKYKKSCMHEINETCKNWEKIWIYKVLTPGTLNLGVGIIYKHPPMNKKKIIIMVYSKLVWSKQSSRMWKNKKVSVSSSILKSKQYFVSEKTFSNHLPSQTTLPIRLAKTMANLIDGIIMNTKENKFFLEIPPHHSQHIFSNLLLIKNHQAKP